MTLLEIFQGLFNYFFDFYNTAAGFFYVYRNPITWLVILGVFVLLLKIFRETWLFYRQGIFKNSIDWVLLEMKIPREVDRTPRAMEQFFKNIYDLKNFPGNFLEKYIEGEVPLWWSFEIVSFGGLVHFYIRTPKKFKKMVESALYAQYANVEVEEVDDYMNTIPFSTKEIYKKNENLFGGEFSLANPDYFPLKTYEDFELSKEEMAIDPISALIEIMAGIHKEETVCIQLLTRPIEVYWKEEGQKYINELIGRGDKKTKNFFGEGIYELAKNLFWAPVEHPTWSEPTKEEKKEDMFSMFKLTSGQQDTLKAVENKLSKQGFESLIRFIYLAPNAIFSTNFARKGILSAWNQYAAQNHNFFINNPMVETRTRWIYFPYIFIKRRVEARKQRILYNYRNRKMPEEIAFGKVYTSNPMNFNNKSKISVLTTNELATIYHVPTAVVLTSPHIKRLESKKMGPPSGLPIFEEE